MATGVGLRIAEDNCTAAIVTDSGESQFIVRESILHMSDDGDTVLGGPAPAGHSHSITGFASAVGNPAGISVDAGEAYRAEDLVATALFCLINLTAEHLNGAAEFYATHPADWPSQYVLSLREALDYLGLRSVLLVSEGDLPGSDAVAPEQSYAYDAARAALAAVLATPAGATPPDPTNAENSTVVTDVIPTVPAPDAQPQAYSAAIPIGEPLPAPVGEPVVAPTAVEAPATAAETPKTRRATPLLIAVAAAIGLVLGGFGVAVLLRDPGATPVPPVRDAKSDQMSTTPTGPNPPVNLPTVPSPTTEPPVVITSTEPETTTEAPTTTPPPTTTEPPSTTPPSTTRPSRTTTTRPQFPMWTAPGWTPQPWEPQYTFDFPTPR
ncbi:hypothetical protein [Nocardia nepalensis]|uniref:hypothetical protein n=1 Tax=Nocardia nepalensis TaxID=3375448 RepID=UPI003B677FB8